MNTRRLTLYSPLFLLLLGLVQCSGGASRQADIEELRQQLEQQRAEIERLRQERRQLLGQPATAEEVFAHFAGDAQSGTLAGLVPGDTIEAARERFGQENRTRTWSSDVEPVTQYEWELEGGVVIRANARPDGRLRKIAVALTNPRGVNIPTLADITIGQETFRSVQQKFRTGLTTDLQLWGAQGLYTVVQRAPYPNSNWRLEFVYEMPDGLGQGQLDRIYEQVQGRQNPAVLDPYLEGQAPYMIGLEESS
jgi:hypothetical protein